MYLSRKLAYNKKGILNFPMLSTHLIDLRFVLNQLD